VFLVLAGPAENQYGSFGNAPGVVYLSSDLPIPGARISSQFGRTNAGMPPHAEHLRRNLSEGTSTVSGAAIPSTNSLRVR
jgi:hypothetical protein